MGDDVQVEISESRRRLNARIHSAGHLLDTAFDCLKVQDLVPSKVSGKQPARTIIYKPNSKEHKMHKITYYPSSYRIAFQYNISIFTQGYHFPEGPYVGE